MISMVLLSEDVAPSAADIGSDLKSNWPDLKVTVDPDQPEEMISLTVNSQMVILAKMPAPFPWSDLEGPCSTSILWPKAKQILKGHKIHWILTVNGDMEPIEHSTLLTQVTAAFLASCPAALGVYWGNATLVVPKPVFIDFAREVLPESPPLHIWVDFRVGKEQDGTSSGFTHGMSALGHMEFETKNCPEAPGDLHERLMSLAGYVVENGPVIRDGDTVGQDANEKIRVVYSKSMFGHEEKVMRLNYQSESPKKPWWKPW